MLTRFMFILLMIFGLFVVSPGIAAAQEKQPGNSRLNRQIRKEILTLPYYGVFDAIGYELEGDTVTLTGFVVRPMTKRDAEEAVADVEGVARVINKIEVLPLSTSDDRLRTRLLRTFVNQGGSLYRYFMGANPSIRIIVKNGHVFLEGYVDIRGDLNLANVLARGVPGSFSVTNNLQVLKEER